MPKQQTIVVLGGGRFPDGRLTDLSIQRLDAALRLFQEHRAESITVLGGVASTYLPGAIAYQMPGADIRADYLIAKGLDDTKINRICGGKDTIGEAIACRDNLPSFNISNFVLVTSSLHVPRAYWLFEKILGFAYRIEPYSVPCGGLLLEEEEKAYFAVTKTYFTENPYCLNETSNWHQDNQALYDEFKAIHDRFHPKGKESQAYCAVSSREGPR